MAGDVGPAARVARARRGAWLVQFLAWQVGAPWVPLSQESNFGQEIPTQVSDDSTITIHGHRFHVPGGYDYSAIGNLDGVQSVAPFRAARNHAMVAPISAGSPEQELTCLLDASSADLWLPSVRCDSCAKDGHDLKGFFHAQASSSFTPAMILTAFGPAPRAMRVVYGSGSVAGFVVNDTVVFGGVKVPKQTFLLAEEGGVAARKDRSWDGVCGFGWGMPEHEGEPLYQRLGEMGRMMVYAFTPTANRATAPELGRLTVGSLPTSPGNVKWTASKPKAHAAKKNRRGMWIASARIRATGGVAEWDGPARALIETGTSFLLVPPYRYLSFVRTLLPNGAFEKLCGVDEQAGNTVICDCAARSQVASQITVSFPDVFGQYHDFPLHHEDLFEEVGPQDGGSKRKVCVLQVQQRPQSTEINSPAGILGPLFLGKGSQQQDAVDADQPPMLPMFGGPFGGQGGPAMMPMGPGPALWPPVPVPAMGNGSGSGNSSLKVANPLQQIVNGLATMNSSNPLQQILGGLASMSKHSVVKEVVVETLGDGTRCETDMLRAGNGSVINMTTTAEKPGGEKKEVHGPTCAKTRTMGSSIFPTPPPAKEKPGPDIHRRLTREASTELWVLGDIFLKRYSVVFDFEQGRLGFVNPLPRGTHGANIEAFQPNSRGGSVGVGAIQTYDTEAPSEGPGVQAFHVRSAVGHMMGRPDDPPRTPSREARAETGHPTSSGVVAVISIFAVGAFVVFSIQGRPRRQNMPRRNDFDEESRDPGLLDASVVE